MNVQHRLAEEVNADNSYEAVACNACAGLHFINRATGRLLGEAPRSAPDSSVC
ncbi:hypothetical protein [Bradyrhizobium sp.]|uniref:hypothetical protein n=1 Tax=Bradyrhizobium sp. TaxID=376 RepID=UPI00345D4B16